MDRIGVRDLSRSTTEVLARVSNGETLEIVEDGRPIARLIPVSADSDTGSDVCDAFPTLARLVAAGRAVPATTVGPVPSPPIYGDPAR